MKKYYSPALLFAGVTLLNACSIRIPMSRSEVLHHAAERVYEPYYSVKREKKDGLRFPSRRQ